MSGNADRLLEHGPDSKNIFKAVLIHILDILVKHTAPEELSHSIDVNNGVAADIFFYKVIVNLCTLIYVT